MKRFSGKFFLISIKTVFNLITFIVFHSDDCCLAFYINTKLNMSLKRINQKSLNQKAKDPEEPAGFSEYLDKFENDHFDKFKVDPKNHDLFSFSLLHLFQI
jgi:hypothetical protein